MPPYGVFHLGLHCLPKYLFTGIQNEQNRVNIVYYMHQTGLQIRVCEHIFYLFLIQNICCGYSKEPSQCSFEHPKRLFKLMGKKILTFLLFKTMNLITNLMSALLFPQIVSVLSSESVFFES